MLRLRYNGGPGASSLFGLFVELGPLLLNDLSLADPLYNATGIPQLVRNPWGWSSVANLLVVDNPPPVGFSYCEPAGVKGDGYSCGNWTDDLAAVANAQALRNFGALFPSSFAGGVYLIGESYAGVPLRVHVYPPLTTACCRRVRASDLRAADEKPWQLETWRSGCWRPVFGIGCLLRARAFQGDAL